MIKLVILFYFLSIFSSNDIYAIENKDYEFYHQQVIKSETLILSENYAEALLLYKQLFNDYDFIFLGNIKLFHNWHLTKGICRNHLNM